MTRTSSLLFWVVIAIILPLTSHAQTTAPSQVAAMNGWNTTPLFTVGETIGSYMPPGIMDGIGAMPWTDGDVRFFVNHELRNDRGPLFQLANGTELQGARVSYFDVDPNTMTIVHAGLASTTIIDRYGNEVTSGTQIADDPAAPATNGINRLCSSSLFRAGEYGLVDDIFFTGEESGGGQEFALNVHTGMLYCLPWLGRAAWENITLLNSGDPSKIAILVGDDRAGAPLLLYIGEKDYLGDGSFLDRNGLAWGKLYAWKSDKGYLSPEDFNGTGRMAYGRFIEINHYDAAMAGQSGYDAQGFADQDTQDDMVAAARCFQFSRPEDVATNPSIPTQAIMASTGRGSAYPSDDWGTMYLIDVNFENLTASVKVIYDGDDAGAGQFAGPDFGLRSPDNLDWADNGFVYVQEDRSTSNGVFGGDSGMEASIWEMNPVSGRMTRIGSVDRSAVPAGQIDSEPADLGNWETSGVLDISEYFDMAGDEILLIGAVQGHSIEGGIINDEDLQEGGQLFFLQGKKKHVTSGNPMIAGQKDFQIEPVFTVSENINGYTPVGIMDGIGAIAWNNGSVRLFVSHELRNNRGPLYQLGNGTELQGGRINYFDIDPATLSVNGAGLAYHTIVDRYGTEVTSGTQISDNPAADPTLGINRPCSASLFEAGEYGLVDDIFFSGEESDGGQEFALDVHNGILYCLPWLGRAAWENITLIDSGDPGKIAILVGDDRAGAPLLLYIGEKNHLGDGSFLDRNGLAYGSLYVWVGNGVTSPEDFNGTGNSITGAFVEIAHYNPAMAGQPGYDAQGFADQDTQDALAAAAGAFQFSRPEDVATNPANGSQIVLASTGRGSAFPSDDWGTTYIIDVDLASLTADISIIYDGDDAGAGQFATPDYGLRSPDNLDWADNGWIYIQEDRSTSNGVFGGESGIEASIWAMNPVDGKLYRIGSVDRRAVPMGQVDTAPGDIGNWETSGILDVSGLFNVGSDEILMAAVVQGHSIKEGPIADGDLQEGGQLVFFRGPNEFTPKTARLQVIHNAPTQTVDVYVNGQLFVDYFAYRVATPYVDVPAGEMLSIGLASGFSANQDEIAVRTPVKFEAGETYVAVANGVVGGTPGFSLEVFPAGRELSGNDNEVSLLFFHGSPDAPEVDILTGGSVIYDNIEYGEFSAGYLNVPADSYELDVTPAEDNSTVVKKYQANMGFWKGRTAVIFASGFFDGSNPAFQPWVALDNGGTFPLIELSPLVDPGSTDFITAKPVAGVYPNPASGVTSLSLDLEQEGIAQATLFNLDGKAMQSWQWGELHAGRYTFELNLNDLKDGVYFLQVQAGENVETHRLIISPRP